MIKPMVLGITVFLASCTASDIKKVENIVKQNLKPTTAESITATKQAIEEGVKTGVSALGAKNGFWQSSYRLLAPKELQDTMAFARNAGLGNYVDRFEKSLNRAAEQAAQAATPVFVDAVKAMTVTDVVGILSGPDNAATKYFESKSSDRLRTTFLPIVEKATSKNEVSKLYKELIQPLAPMAKLAGFNIPNVSLEEYVTQQTISALFVKIADEEKKIRKNPAERSTQLLKKVFGYYQNKKR
ncbi:MAG: DUF4197 domain-containing protein [Pseudobacteriovorax sp.]|nr:DUF4197 domain-containing protein [Pseudobacteriovorax sp.]